MLLQFSDVGVYLPSLADVPQPEIERFIAIAHTVAESSIGANRPLGLTSFTELLDINPALGSVQLSYWPVQSIEVLQVRSGHTRSRTRRGIPAGRWHNLSAEQYELDIDGRLHLGSSGASSFGRASYPGGGTHYTKAQITYTAGFDPQQAAPELNTLKNALAQVVTYLVDSQESAGIKTLKVEKQYSVEYFGGASTDKVRPGTNNNYGVPELYLLPFRKYLPRGGIV